MSWSIYIPKLNSQNHFIDAVTSFILENLNQELNLDDLAKCVDISPFYLCRIFKKHLNISPMKWLWLQRTIVAATYLSSKPQFNLTDIAFACGFSSSAHFSRYFKSVYEISPSCFRKTFLGKRSDLIGPFSHMIKDEFKFEAANYSSY